MTTPGAKVRTDLVFARSRKERLEEQALPLMRALECLLNDMRSLFIDEPFTASTEPPSLETVRDLAMTAWGVKRVGEGTTYALDGAPGTSENASPRVPGEEYSLLCRLKDSSELLGLGADGDSPLEAFRESWHYMVGLMVDGCSEQALAAIKELSSSQLLFLISQLNTIAPFSWAVSVDRPIGNRELLELGLRFCLSNKVKQALWQILVEKDLTDDVIVRMFRSEMSRTGGLSYAQEREYFDKVTALEGAYLHTADADKLLDTGVSPYLSAEDSYTRAYNPRKPNPYQVPGAPLLVSDETLSANVGLLRPLDTSSPPQKTAHLLASLAKELVEAYRRFGSEYPAANEAAAASTIEQDCKNMIARLVAFEHYEQFHSKTEVSLLDPLRKALIEIRNRMATYRIHRESSEHFDKSFPPLRAEEVDGVAVRIEELADKKRLLDSVRHLSEMTSVSLMGVGGGVDGSSAPNESVRRTMVLSAGASGYYTVCHEGVNRSQLSLANLAMLRPPVSDWTLRIQGVEGGFFPKDIAGLHEDIAFNYVCSLTEDASKEWLHNVFLLTTDGLKAAREGAQAFTKGNLTAKEADCNPLALAMVESARQAAREQQKESIAQLFKKAVAGEPQTLLLFMRAIELYGELLFEVMNELYPEGKPGSAEARAAIKANVRVVCHYSPDIIPRAGGTDEIVPFLEEHRSKTSRYETLSEAELSSHIVLRYYLSSMKHQLCLDNYAELLVMDRSLHALAKGLYERSAAHHDAIDYPYEPDDSISLADVRRHRNMALDVEEELRKTCAYFLSGWRAEQPHRLPILEAEDLVHVFFRSVREQVVNNHLGSRIAFLEGLPRYCLRADTEQLLAQARQLQALFNEATAEFTDDLPIKIEPWSVSEALASAVPPQALPMAGAGAAGGTSAPEASDSTLDPFLLSAAEVSSSLRHIFHGVEPDCIQKISRLLARVIDEEMKKADFSQELVSCAKAFLQENGQKGTTVVAPNSRFFTQETSGDNNARLVDAICTYIIEKSDNTKLVDGGLAKINTELVRLIEEHRPSAPAP